jgi:hypothetical protein
MTHSRGRIEAVASENSAGLSSKDDQITPAEKRDQAATSSNIADGDSGNPHAPSFTLNPYAETASGLKSQARRSKSRSSGQKTHPQQAPTKGSLLSDIVSDLRQFPKAAYPYWKWLLLAYLIWILSTWVMRTIYTTIVNEIQPVCSTPWLGPKLPWCYVPSSTAIANAIELPTSHQQLEEIVTSTGKGLGLAMNMMSNEYAVRHLNVRVKYSELKHKDELGEELDTLISLNVEASE